LSKPSWLNCGVRNRSAGYLKANQQPTVSHESIYQRIYADRRAGGTLHRALRCQKARRKRYGGRERRGTIPNQVSIDLRPAIVDNARALSATGRAIW
jgi:IS30 family transposase